MRNYLVTYFQYGKLEQLVVENTDWHNILSLVMNEGVSEFEIIKIEVLPGKVATV